MYQRSKCPYSHFLWALEFYLTVFFPVSILKQLNSFQLNVAFHIETSYWAKQKAGFYVKRNIELRWVNR